MCGLVRVQQGHPSTSLSETSACFAPSCPFPGRCSAESCIPLPAASQVMLPGSCPGLWTAAYPWEGHQAGVDLGGEERFQDSCGPVWGNLTRPREITACRGRFFLHSCICRGAARGEGPSTGLPAEIQCLPAESRWKAAGGGG